MVHPGVIVCAVIVSLFLVVAVCICCSCCCDEDPALGNLDLVTYLRTTDQLAHHGDEDGCGICQAPFVGGDRCSVMPLCGHQFHWGCVQGWLRAYNTTCPRCGDKLQWDAVRSHADDITRTHHSSTS